MITLCSFILARGIRILVFNTQKSEFRKVFKTRLRYRTRVGLAVLSRMKNEPGPTGAELAVFRVESRNLPKRTEILGKLTWRRTLCLQLSIRYWKGSCIRSDRW